MAKLKKVVVTGAGGFIGSHLAEFLLKKDFDVYGTFYHPAIDLREINPKIKLKKIDIRDKKGLLKTLDEINPTIIFHLAAQSFPTVSWQKPVMTIETNVIGTTNLFENIKELKLKPIVLVAGSSAEYGLVEKEEIPVKENHPLRPLNPYGVSKVAQELQAYQYFKSFGIKTITIRIFNTTGPRKTGDVCSDFTKRAVMVEKGLKKDIEVGNLETKRAITDVRDTISGLYLAAKKGTPGESYNLSGAKIYKISEILGLVIKITNISVKIKKDPKLFRPTDEPIIYGDSSKLVKKTGWKQKITIEQTLTDMINYWREKL